LTIFGSLNYLLFNKLKESIMKEISRKVFEHNEVKYGIVLYSTPIDTVILKIFKEDIEVFENKLSKDMYDACVATVTEDTNDAILSWFETLIKATQ